MNELKTFVKDFENNKIKLVNKNMVTLERYIFLYSLILSRKLDNEYGDILKEYVLNVEKIFPSSSIKLLKELYKENNDKDLIKKVPKLKDLKNYFVNTINNKDFIDTFFNILEFSGPDSIIDIHKSNLKNQIIKRKESKFDISINQNFFSIFFSNNKFVKRSCGLVLIDGLGTDSI